MVYRIDPKSLAGILIVEHDSLESALRYAEKLAHRCADSRSEMAFEYQDAAELIRFCMRGLNRIDPRTEAAPPYGPRKRK